MKIDFNFSSLLNDESLFPDDDELCDLTEFFYDYPLEIVITDVVVLVLCILGMVGNGILIGMLGRHIARNSLTIYIMNLAIADFGALLLLLLLVLTLTTRGCFDDATLYLFMLLVLSKPMLFLYVTSHVLLTAISIDSCVIVLFPIWHRCRRPKHLSTTSCGLIWSISFLICGIDLIVFLTGHAEYSDEVDNFPFALTALVCLVVTTVSTVTLLAKVCCKLQQYQGRRLLLAVLLELLFFTIFTIPQCVLYFTFHYFSFENLMEYTNICICLQSSINSLIYLSVGRQEKGQGRERLKVRLQRVFKEIYYGQEVDPPTLNQDGMPTLSI